MQIKDKQVLLQFIAILLFFFLFFTYLKIYTDLLICDNPVSVDNIVYIIYADTVEL